MKLYEDLVYDLNQISLMAGRFEMSPEARQAYVDWYVAEDARMRSGQMPIDDVRFASYCERRTTHVRKVMMSLAASRSNSLVIERGDFDRALLLLKQAEAKMGKTFGGLGTSKYSDMTETVRNYIQQFGITTRSILLAKFWRDIDSESLSRVEATLSQMGVIKVTLTKTGDKTYEWVG
jgi:hypothetical protein